MAHLAIVRSPMVHARIGRVDVSAALERPGVVAAFTGRDLAPDYGSLPTVWIVSDDLIVPDHPPIAADEARYLGDAVAVVVAEDPYQAADAVEAVQVEYEPLPAVVDQAAALADGAPLVHAGQATNRAFTWSFSGGDYAAARHRAKVAVSRRFVQQRVMPTAMEPRAVLAEPFPATGEFTLWTSTQVPHFVRLLMSSVCGIGEQKLRVIAPDVGGGFGGKLNVYAEEAIALAVARRLGRPVKWTATRSEDYQATTHGRDMIQDVEIAAARDGRVLRLKVDLTSDFGAYLQLLTPAVPLLGRYVYPGIYKFGAHEFSCQGVFTTKTPTDSYRGAGRPEATFAVERIMDELAAELGLDPLELRQRNWISHDEFPYTTVTGLTYDKGRGRPPLRARGQRPGDPGHRDRVRDGRGQHERAGRRHPGAGGHLARGDRQAGAVRSRRDGRHRGQADRSVRRVPGRTSARSRAGA
jgi:aerobic carbon-monoxide dehydrogenase large subunit